jgi:hypothetical protein
MAADGLAKTAIAQRLDVHVDVVSRWRKPFAEGGLAGLACRKRTGPAAHVHRTGGRAGEGAGVRAARGERDTAGEVELPGPRDRGPGGITASISARTVRRWLAQDVLKPWRHRSWIFPATRFSRSRPPACSTCISGSGRPGRWRHNSAAAFQPGQRGPVIW